MEALALAIAGLSLGIIALLVYVELLRRRIDSLEQVAASQAQFNKSTVGTIGQIVKGMK
jgi:biopolymer transport protein ExbB/TolQ